MSLSLFGVISKPLNFAKLIGNIWDLIQVVKPEQSLTGPKIDCAESEPGNRRNTSWKG